MTEAKSLKARAVAETKAFLFIAIYLALLFGSFTVYRRLILSEYHDSYLHYGYAIVEALVLGKVILIGRMLHVGERFRDLPLIVPVLWKTFSFSLLVIAFSVLERVVESLFHHRGLGAAFEEVAAQGKAEILARVLILFTALVPLFILVEIGEVLGEGKLFALFFRRRTKVDAAIHIDADSKAKRNANSTGARQA
jgi:hypothetical protein